MTTTENVGAIHSTRFEVRRIDRVLSVLLDRVPVDVATCSVSVTAGFVRVSVQLRSVEDVERCGDLLGFTDPAERPVIDAGPGESPWTSHDRSGLVDGVPVKFFVALR